MISLPCTKFISCKREFSVGEKIILNAQKGMNIISVKSLLFSSCLNKVCFSFKSSMCMCLKTTLNAFSKSSALHKQVVAIVTDYIWAAIESCRRIQFLFSSRSAIVEIAAFLWNNLISIASRLETMVRIIVMKQC